METHLNREQTEAQRKASVLIEALPYIQKFNRKIVVIKYGGSAMNNEELQRNVIKDVTDHRPRRRKGYQQLGEEERKRGAVYQRPSRD